MSLEEQTIALMKLLESLPHSAPQNLVREFGRGEVFLLNHIYASGGCARPGSLSNALGTSTARIAAALKNMERKGWITRKEDPDDRRSTIVSLTGKGSSLIEECRSFILSKISEVFAQLGERDTAEFLRITQKMADISRNLKSDKIYDHIQKTLMGGSK